MATYSSASEIVHNFTCKVGKQLRYIKKRERKNNKEEKGVFFETLSLFSPHNWKTKQCFQERKEERKKERGDTNYKESSACCSMLQMNRVVYSILTTWMAHSRPSWTSFSLQPAMRSRTFTCEVAGTLDCCSKVKMHHKWAILLTKNKREKLASCPGGCYRCQRTQRLVNHVSYKKRDRSTYDCILMLGDVNNTKLAGLLLLNRGVTIHFNNILMCGCWYDS